MNIRISTPHTIGIIPILVMFLSVTYLPFSHGQSKPLNIIVIGAHPDDADLCAGGTAILWSQMGHRVKFLSLTNGDAGHQDMGGGALAKRRRAEATEVARRMGIAEYEVLDNHDGELMPTLDVRLQVIRRIRNWNADVVILPRPNDYHPDHRNTGLVVQDAAYMVIVPNVASDTPPLKNNPVFLYCQDRFQKPNPFEADVAVNIEDVFYRKVDGLDAHVSQFYEWLPWTVHALDQVPKDIGARKEWLATIRQRPITESIRKALTYWYGEDGEEIALAEGFEICEYGRQPSTDEDIMELFPMLRHNPSLSLESSETALNIDGKLDEAVYRSLTKHELVNSMNGQEVEAGQKTYFQLFQSDTDLHIAFHVEDRDIISKYKNRDDHLWTEDAVEAFINTDSNPMNYFEIEVSPAGVLFDSYITDPEHISLIETPAFDFSGIRYAVHLGGSLNDSSDSDQSWSVEIAIPLKELQNV